MRLLADSFAGDLRDFLLKTDRLHQIEAFPQKDDASRRVFFEAKLSTVVYVAELFAPPGTVRVATHPWDRVQSDSPSYVADTSQLLSLSSSDAVIPIGLDDESWRLLVKLEQDAGTTRLSDVGRWSTGEIMEGPTLRPYLAKVGCGVPLARGGNVARFEFKEEAKQGENVFVDLDRLRSERPRSAKLADQQKPRIVFQECAAVDNYRRIVATAVRPGILCAKTLSYLCDTNVSLESVLALLNSAVIEWRFNLTSTTNHVTLPEVGRLPFVAAAGSNADFRTLAEHATESCRLSDEKEESQARFRAELWRTMDLASEHGESWTGVSRLRDLDYFGWEGRFPAWQPDERSAEEAHWYPNGVSPPLEGDGPGEIPWDLIARVYPSYPLPGIDAEAWEAAAWDDLCGLLRKNKTKIGNPRIRADLTGSGRIEHPTGALRQLREMFLEHHRQIRANRARAAELDLLIDRIVFRLFDLTLDEQKLILSRVGPGRPLPPRRGRKRKKAKQRVDRNLRLFEDG